MPLELIEITSSRAVLRKTLSELKTTSLREVVSSHTAPACWLVSEQALPLIAQLSELIGDKGMKRPEVELSRSLLRGKNNGTIPMIRAHYSSAGKLLSSVYRLLEKAQGGETKLFLLVVEDRILNAIQITESEKSQPQPRWSSQARGHEEQLLSLLQHVPESESLHKAFLGESANARVVRQLIMLAAQSNATVMILGDTGTGKEIVAKQIHSNSARKDKPFVPINCSAIPTELLESELFGSLKGAWTGANTTKLGLWEAADGGTLFLDEIGELPLSQQSKLLRVLQEKKIRKVGDNKEIEVDVRIICATNRDLFGGVQAGTFRDDLYFRLREFVIFTYPLHDQREDIPILARAFWRESASNDQADLSEEILNELQAYPWPGNVRELKLVLTSLYVYFHNAGPLDGKHLRAILRIDSRIHDYHKSKSRGSQYKTPSFRPFSLFRRLRQVYATLRAMDRLISPLLQSETVPLSSMPEITARVVNILNELNQHLREPRLFSANSFTLLTYLQSKLFYFNDEYKQSWEIAVQHLLEGFRLAMDKALTNILAEIDITLNGALEDR